MNLSTDAVKVTAKTALKGNYLKSIIACTIYIFTILVCSFCHEIIGSVLGAFAAFVFIIAALVFLIIPLTLGVVYFTMRLIFSKDAQPVLVFKYFSSGKDYSRSLGFALPLMGNAAYSGFLLFLPAIITELIANGTAFEIFGLSIPLWTSSLSTVAVILKYFAGFCLALVMLKYYLAPFLLVIDENMNPLEAMHISRVISNVTKRDFIWLILSFSLYILACFFLVPNIFILPYFFTAYCVHCRFATAAYNKNIDNISQRNIPSFEVI